jgi:deazaflavin-dependent oxidoreductase (nitroreductase family)
VSPAARSQIRLTTTGRHSGAPRTVTLYAFDAGEGRLAIVGSRGGAARHPAWALNLRAEPDALVTVGRTERQVHAREVPEGDERDRLWALVCEAFPLYLTYQRRTKRLIPLFVLDPPARDWDSE